MFPGLNLFVGPNGAGKTAIIEALHLLACGKSFRCPTVGPVIQQGAESLTVHAQFYDEQRGEIAAGVVRHRSNRSELHLNGSPERRVSEVARVMPVQLILPDSSSLVLGAPHERRRFVDWGTFHVEPSYLEHLRDYQRILQQRNALLKSQMGEASNFAGELKIWTERLVSLGLIVDAARRRYLGMLFPVILRKVGELAPEVALTISYRPGWREGETLEDCLQGGRARDVRFGITHYGPHRAEIRLLVDAETAATRLSRGQAKTVANALRLAQATLTNEIGGRQSLFLIDDIGAELDPTHNERFFRALESMGSQVLATATASPALGSAFASHARQLFHVEQGSCHPIGTQES